MKTLLIIPTYNERESLPALLSALEKVKDVDILFVDDNSPDGTAEYIKAAVAMHKNINLLERPGKGGLASAYIMGFAWGLARGYKALAQMDADLSHDPKYLYSMIKALGEHHVVVGSRYISGGGVENWPWFRRFISRGGSLYAKLILGLPIKDLTSGFNLWRAEALQAIDLPSIKSSGYSFQIEMKHLAHQAGLKIKEVPIIFKERINGKSKMSKKIFIEAIWRVILFRLNNKFFKFIIVGCLGLVIDLGLTVLLVELFKINVYVAGTFAFVLSAFNNYLLNKFWAFKNKNKNYAKQFMIFLAVSVAGLGLNLAFLKLFIYCGLWYVLAKLLATVLVTFWNYFVNSVWTFKIPDRD